MAVYITGDYHGGFDAEKLEPHLFPEGQNLTRDDYVIITGDFGLPWDYIADSSDDLDVVESYPWTTLFIDGNHECFPYLESLPVSEWHGGRVHIYPDYPHIIHLMRGEAYELEGKTIFCMGGATSPDAGWREEGLTWFAQELPGERDFEHAQETLERIDWTCDYVITHTCCSSLLHHALAESGVGMSEPLPDRLTDFLDDLECDLEYERWYFGHFHFDGNVKDSSHVCLYNCVVPLGENPFFV